MFQPTELCKERKLVGTKQLRLFLLSLLPSSSIQQALPAPWFSLETTSCLVTELHIVCLEGKRMDLYHSPQGTGNQFTLTMLPVSFVPLFPSGEAPVSNEVTLPHTVACGVQGTVHTDHATSEFAPLFPSWEAPVSNKVTLPHSVGTPTPHPPPARSPSQMKPWVLCA